MEGATFYVWSSIGRHSKYPHRVLVLLFAGCITEEIICTGKINLVSMQPSRQHKSARDRKGAPTRGLALSVPGWQAFHVDVV